MRREGGCTDNPDRIVLKDATSLPATKPLALTQDMTKLLPDMKVVALSGSTADPLCGLGKNPPLQQRYSHVQFKTQVLL